MKKLFLIISVFLISFFVFSNLFAQEARATDLSSCLSLSYSSSTSHASPNDQVTWTATVSNICSSSVGGLAVWASYAGEFSVESTGGFSNAGGWLTATTPGIEAGGSRSWSWTGRPNGNCGGGGNFSASSVLEVESASDGHFQKGASGAVTVYVGISVAVSNNTAAFHNFSVRVLNNAGSVAGGPHTVGIAANSSGSTPQMFNINCDQGPFTVQWSVDGGGYRSDSASPQNFNVTNGCITQVTVSYNDSGGTPPQPTSPPVAPIGVNLTVNGSDGPITVGPGTIVTLAWGTAGSPSNCVASGYWTGLKSTSGGSENVTVNQSSTYNIACSKSGTDAVSDSVTVNVVAGGGTGPAPSAPPPGQIGVDLKVNGSNGPITVPAGNVQLSWQTFNSPYWCIASWGGGKLVEPSGGSDWDAVFVNTTYTIRCQREGFADAVDSVTVNIGVSPPPAPPPAPPPPPPIILNGLVGASFRCDNGELMTSVAFAWASTGPTGEAYQNYMVIDYWSGGSMGSGSQTLININPWPAPVVDVPGLPQNTRIRFQGILNSKGGVIIYGYTLYTSPNCPKPTADFDLNNVDSDLQFYSDSTYTVPKQSFEVNEPIFVEVKVKNILDATSVTFNNAFYLDSAASPNSNCSGNPAPSQTQTLNGLGAGTVAPAWRFTINAPSTPGVKTAYAFADSSCQVVETSEDNNIRSKVYIVSVDSWFETVNGDVGSHGDISISQANPPGYQSSYLIAGQSIDSKVRTQKWKIDGYDKRLVPVGGVYNFFADRFLKKAQGSGQNLCSITGGTRNGFWYCNSNATFDSTSVMAGSSVWFIDGDLTIKKNLTIGANDAVTFIVKGNITVETGVDRIDGLYVTNGTLSDYDPLAGKAGRQLVINGGVYARTTNLGRILGGALCPSGTQCNNSQTAAVKLVYDPKYLLGLNNVLGSPDLDWREVAP